jgi:hypothetical protein
MTTIINQINAMSKERREQFVWFLNSMFLEHIDIEMFGAEGNYFYHEIDFDFVSSLDEMVCNMNDAIADNDFECPLSEFVNHVCNNLSQYQEFIDLLNQCDADYADVNELKPFINYDAAIAKFESMRTKMFKVGDDDSDD